MNNPQIRLARWAASILFLLWLVAPSVAQPLSSSRGYTTTPQELQTIAQKANSGIQPYKDAVDEVLDWANREWTYQIVPGVECNGADNPRWIDEDGAGIVYANALAYHLTGNDKYAKRVVNRIKMIISTVIKIPKDQQCRLNFAWGIPEYIAAADLIGDYWDGMTCTGPLGTTYKDKTLGTGDCKQLFQNWLAKNAYFIISLSAPSQGNWGAAAANATAYISDYLWDRPEVVLYHRHPKGMLNGVTLQLSPAAAYEYANQLTLDRMNGYGIEYNGSTSCDYMSGSQQKDTRAPVKNQFSERGIIPQDARREQYCNIGAYNGEYQNYPQIHINNTLQQCELMLRRGSRACYDNIRLDDIPNYQFMGPDGVARVTHLYPGRGSIERVINAIIVDSGTEWRHDSALYVAYRYYKFNSRFGQVATWQGEMDRSGSCSQGVCFGMLTHAFAPGEMPSLPPTVPPPGDDNRSVPLPLPPPG